MQTSRNAIPACVPDGYEHILGDVLAYISKPGAEKEALGVWRLDAVTEHQDIFDVVSDVAVIPVRGMLVPELSFGGSSWITGYNILQMQIDRAFDSSSIRGIVLDINSFGGLVEGLFDLVEWIHDAKAEAGKPIVAIVNTVMASAAYTLGSACDSISCPPLGGVGSLGIKMVHVEFSEFFKKEGITHTIIKSGEWKGLGSIYEKLDERMLQEWNKDANEIRDLMAEVIAIGRGSAGFDVEAIKNTEAFFYNRPSKIEEALSLGMIDAILRPDEAFTQFVESLR